MSQVILNKARPSTLNVSALRPTSVANIFTFLSRFVKRKLDRVETCYVSAPKTQTKIEEKRRWIMGKVF